MKTICLSVLFTIFCSFSVYYDLNCLPTKSFHELIPEHVSEYVSEHVCLPKDKPVTNFNKFHHRGKITIGSMTINPLAIRLCSTNLCRLMTIKKEPNDNSSIAYESKEYLIEKICDFLISNEEFQYFLTALTLSSLLAFFAKIVQIPNRAF